MFLRHLSLAWLALVTAVFAVSPPGPAKRDRTAELGPEVVEKRAELNRKVRESKGRHWGATMTAEIARVADAVKLSDAQRKDLEAPAAAAVAEAIEEWIRWGQANWVNFMPDSKEEALALLEQAIGTIEASVRQEFPGNYTPPADQPKWHEGLKRVLTAEQWARWEEVRQERERELDKLFEEELSGPVAQLRTAATEQVHKRLEAMRAPLRLTPERIKEIESAAEKVATKLVDTQLKQVRTALGALDPETRKTLVRGGNPRRGMLPMDAMMGLPTSEEEIAALFTEDERRAIKEQQESGRSARSRALGRILVAAFDEEVAFTAPQREKLIPFAEAAVKSRPELFPDADRQQYYQINLSRLLASGSEVPEAELQRFLDPVQLRRWKEAATGKGLNTSRRNPFVDLNQGQPVSATPKPSPEPEAVEMAISDALYERAQNERRRLLGQNLLKAEDVARVCSLAPELASRLATAARGSADAELESWKSGFEQNIRAQLRDVAPENIRQRLAGLDRNFSMRSSRDPGAAVGVLDAAVKSTLTEAQRKSWEVELAARRDFRQAAVANLIMTDFAADTPISPASWTKLEPLILQAVKTYEPDIDSMFSYYDTEWFLQSNSLYVPFAAVPEAEIKAAIGEARWNEWSKHPHFATAQNYWENIQRIHANRTRMEKQREEQQKKQKP